jgi:hypothetical protein
MLPMKEDFIYDETNISTTAIVSGQFICLLRQAAFFVFKFKGGVFDVVLFLSIEFLHGMKWEVEENSWFAWC